MGDTPNLLFLWTDEQAAETMAAYGNDQIETPNLDELAESGVVFENAYCTAPVCTPSRSAIMTGKWPHETGCVVNNVSLSEDHRCLPEFVGDEYATGHFGKWHLGDEIFPQHGFEEWIGIEDNYVDYYSEGRPRDARSEYHEFLVDQGFEPDINNGTGPGRFSRQFAAGLPEEFSKPKFIADHAIEFLGEHRDEPFVLSVNFLEPHFPYTGPRDDQYDPDDVPLPPNFEHEGFASQASFVRDRRTSYLADRHPLDGDPPPTGADFREFISNYWGLVSLVDTHIGRILRALEANDLRDNTVVVFTSDHGDMLGSHTLWRKNLMFEESVRVPLLMRVTDEDLAGTRVTSRMSQIDLVPTILDVLDSPQRRELCGRSWLPHLTSDEERDDDVLIQYYPHTDAVLADRPNLSGATSSELRDRVPVYHRCIVTQTGWKYVARSDGDDSLYDLDTDPHETQNLAANPDFEQRKTGLQNRLTDLQHRFDDPFSFT